MEKIPQPENRIETLIRVLAEQRERIEKEEGEMAKRLLSGGVVERVLGEMGLSPLRVVIQEDNSGDDTDRLSLS